jgi:hypothetical protein
VRIGIDFDNTIVSYDALFHKVAVEQGLVSPAIPVNKVLVRDHLREIGQEDRWTEMQGYVYGARMGEAISYPGALEFFQRAVNAGHDLAIVSHKTRHPYMGPKYDLHAAAREWVGNHLVINGVPILPPQKVFFELTKEEKLARVASLRCDVFIDDLPEILSAPSFPKFVRPILFDPERNHQESIPSFSSWSAIASELALQ